MNERAHPLTESTPGTIDWRISYRPVDYRVALDQMERRAAAINSGNASEQIWLLEHPPLYTAGTSARDKDLLKPERFPVFKSGRGGQFTYHGPGQRVVYLMMDLKRRRRDVRCYVHTLEDWLIRTLSRLNVTGERRNGRVGIWVRRTNSNNPDQDDKIAAIGVRIKRWVTLHGISLNVCPDLAHFDGIVPCGINQHGITSLKDLGQNVSMAEVDMVLRGAFEESFGPDSEMARR